MGNSMLTSILFPAPASSYSLQAITEYEGIKMFSAYNKTCSLFVPCFSENKQFLSNKALIYFHGNAEDLGESMHWFQTMKKILNVNIFANQYPGYGVYKSKNCLPEVINYEAVGLYRYVNEVLGFPDEDIVVVGRSIGSGPACHVAANTNCRTLVLISPFFNIKSMINQKTLFLSFAFSEVFPNSENIKRTKARLLLFHGEKDNVIDVKNSRGLMDVYRTELNRNDGEFIFHPHMTHNDFHLKRDILLPMQKFLSPSTEMTVSYERVMEVLNESVIKK